MVVHIVKMCTFFLGTFHEYFLIFEGCWTEAFFRQKMLRWCLGCVICNSNSFYSFILKLFIRIGLQNRFQNFKQRAWKGIQIGSVFFVAIFSWRRERKKNTDLQIRMRNWQLNLTHLGYSKRTVSPFREYMFELMVKKIVKFYAQNVWLNFIICVAESGVNTSCHKSTPIQKLCRICRR